LAYRWFDVCSVDELLPGTQLRVEVDGFPVCLIHLSDGDYLACEDSCPHAGVSLAAGGIVDTQAKTLTCASHMWCFKLDTGSCADFPHVRLRRFPMSEENGRLFVGFWNDDGDGPDPLNRKT